ncbi:hypothetical protein GP486_005479 [Trichoglossum hirsutum]|uniref:Ras guanine-nucleotide exchange protein n=1 Tax=Trichoglossum hirsutum TaxID=265104 RepID=A0A9P8L958_9PEZI|nr:hypothetical protein GP486_005479 [Trichoglossum hirsutum]
MKDSENSSSSVYVAPLHIVKGHTRNSSSVSQKHSLCSSSRSRASSAKSHSQITPPPTPNGSQETLLRQPEPPLQPVFHKFLRAFYPFNPASGEFSSTVTLSLKEGEIIMVHSIHTNGWADGTLLASDTRGWLPTNYCEAYDAGQIRNLLRALLNFWDLVRGETQANIEVFYNQEFMKGIIAGENTGCLTRESELVKGHSGLRAHRKALLADLSALVRTAKRLQDVALCVRNDEKIGDVIDEIILKAFKIAIRGVKFLDVWEQDFGSYRMLDELIDFGLEEAIAPPTPPAEYSATFTPAVQEHVYGIAEDGLSGDTQSPSGNDMNLVLHSDAPAKDDWEQTGLPLQTHAATAANRSSTSYSTHHASASRPTSMQINNRLSISHRVSYTGESTGPRNYNLASERLSATHDIFLSYLGSFIGRLHLQSRSSAELLLTTQQSVASGRDLLAIIEAVWERDPQRAESLEQAKDALYGTITDLVLAAREVVIPSRGQEDTEDIMMPDEGRRLMGAATGCVKAAGECVAKTKFVIERIGDFEFEGTSSFDGLGFSATIFEVSIDEGRGKVVREAEEEAERRSPVSDASSPDVGSVDHSQTPTLPIQIPEDDKPLPDVPCDSPVLGDPAGVRSTQSPMGDLLPPLPLLSGPLMLDDDHTSSSSAITESKENDSKPNYDQSLRTDSIVTLGTGTENTFVDSVRDSETSLVSRRISMAAAAAEPSATNTTPPELSSSTPDASTLNIDHTMSGSETTLAEECEETEAKLLEKTFAHELVFNKEGQITGGTLPALIERLTTHDSTPDSMFVSTFYLTFRLFTTPTDFARALVNRFDYVADSPHIAAPVRLRVYNVFKGWLESHWRQSADHGALDVIVPFANEKLKAVLPAAGKRLIELAEKVSSVNGPLVPRLVSSIGKTNTSIAQYIAPDTPLPAPLVSRSQLNHLRTWKVGGSSPSILDFDPLELARQFTLKESRIFCSILPDELLATEWMKKSGSIAINVRAMSTLSTDLATLVADTILHPEDAKKRASIIKQWVKISNKCLELNNYDSLMAIICSLNSSTILRLKRTWDMVSQKTKTTLNNLRSIVDVSRNYAVLRQRLQNHVPPCLPFVGTYLTDLTFVDVGNQATRQLSGDTAGGGVSVINFDKHMKTAKIIGELQRFQIPYRLTEVPELQEWIQAQIVRVRSSDSSSVQEYYRRSLLLEPRETPSQRSTPVESQPSNSLFLGWGLSTKDRVSATPT